jgi:hypothetical protein
MSDEVRKVTIQIKAPRGRYGGEVAIGYYCLVEGSVVLTDENGKPTGADRRPVLPGEDAHLIACRMVRSGRKAQASVAGFNRPLVYPKLRY